METTNKNELIQLQNFTQRLNREPDSNELGSTPDGKAKTLPISFIEMTLDELFFGQWSTENFKWSAITNEVQGSIDLVVTHPITGQQIRRTGAASIIITVDKAPEGLTGPDRNKWAMNPENKKSNALDLGFPKLKAECLKNAAQSLGKIFGRDLNRKEKDTFKQTLIAIPDQALKAAIERVEKGANEFEVIALCDANFILNEDQIDMIRNAKQSLQLNEA